MASDLSTALGLDIGSRYTKLVELKKSSKKIELVRSVMAETPQQSEEIPAFIRQFLQRSQISSSTVVWGLPKSHMALKYLQLAPSEPEQIRKVLESEVQKLLPFPPKDITFCYHLQKKLLNKKAQILLVALRKDLLDQYASLLRQGEFETRIIELSPLAQIDGYLYSYNPASKDPIALMDIGATTTTITILKEELLRFSRDIPIGGDTITAAIKDKLDLDWQEATEMKERIGVVLGSGETDETSVEISYALEPILDQLIIETERSLKISYYIDHPDLITPQVLVLTGGSSHLKNLDKYLEKRLNVPATRANPFHRIEVPEGQGENAATWGIAVGLALRGLLEFPITFNLLSDREK